MHDASFSTIISPRSAALDRSLRWRARGEFSVPARMQRGLEMILIVAAVALVCTAGATAAGGGSGSGSSSGAPAAHLPRCAGTTGRWCGSYLAQAPVAYKGPPPVRGKRCPGGCSGVGVCHGDSGVCDCPAGARRCCQSK